MAFWTESIGVCALGNGGRFWEGWSQGWLEAFTAAAKDPGL